LESLKGRNHMDDLGENVRMILKRVLKKLGGCGMDSSGSG
jgi:hypothetical protein